METNEKATKKTALSEEARAARNAYHREWRKKHPEKMREYYLKRWEKKAAENAETKDG